MLTIKPGFLKSGIEGWDGYIGEFLSLGVRFLAVHAPFHRVIRPHGIRCGLLLLLRCIMVFLSVSVPWTHTLVSYAKIAEPTGMRLRWRGWGMANGDLWGLKEPCIRWGPPTLQGIDKFFVRGDVASYCIATVHNAG